VSGMGRKEQRDCMSSQLHIYLGNYIGRSRILRATTLIQMTSAAHGVEWTTELKASCQNLGCKQLDASWGVFGGQKNIVGGSQSTVCRTAEKVDVHEVTPACSGVVALQILVKIR